MLAVFEETATYTRLVTVKVSVHYETSLISNIYAICSIINARSTRSPTCWDHKTLVLR